MILLILDSSKSYAISRFISKMSGTRVIIVPSLLEAFAVLEKETVEIVLMEHNCEENDLNERLINRVNNEATIIYYNMLANLTPCNIARLVSSLGTYHKWKQTIYQHSASEEPIASTH